MIVNHSLHLYVRLVKSLVYSIERILFTEMDVSCKYKQSGVRLCITMKSFQRLVSEEPKDGLWFL